MRENVRVSVAFRVMQGVYWVNDLKKVLTSLVSSLFSFFFSLDLKWDGGGDSDPALSSLLPLFSSSPEDFPGDFCFFTGEGLLDFSLVLVFFLVGEGDGPREEPEEAEESELELLESLRGRVRGLTIYEKKRKIITFIRLDIIFFLVHVCNRDTNNSNDVCLWRKKTWFFSRF